MKLIRIAIELVERARDNAQSMGLDVFAETRPTQRQVVSH